MGPLEALENPPRRRGTLVLGDHASEPSPVEQLMLEGEIAEQCLDVVLALLESGLRRRRQPSGGDPDGIWHSAEVTDRLGEEPDALAGLVGVRGELALDLVRRRLGAPALGDHDLRLGESQQPVQLRDKINIRWHVRPLPTGAANVTAHPCVVRHTRGQRTGDLSSRPSSGRDP